MEASENLNDFFELARIGDWVSTNDFKRIALQLPNAYLKYSFEIVTELERRLGGADERKLFVLADTSYRR